jgi:hypothetical protein
MKIAFCEIPDDENDWPAWLERRLVRLDLFQLAEDLNTLRGEREYPPETLESVCGQSLDKVLLHGVRSLSTRQISLLMRQPELLLELQDVVLSQGGVYWDQVSNAEREASKVSLSGNQSSTFLLDEEHKVVVRQNSPTSWPYRRASLAAVAATIFIAIGVWISRPVPSSGGGWGLDNPELLSANVSGELYFKKLADAAATFPKKGLDTKDNALKRITEFKAGCYKIARATHPQIKNIKARQLLTLKCEEWSAKLDTFIDQIKSTPTEWESVVSEAVKLSEEMKIEMMVMSSNAA